MTLFIFTPSDVKKTKIIDAGWYRFKVTEFKPMTSKKGSKLFFYTLVGLTGDATEVPVTVMYGEQYPQYMIPFLQACTDAEFSETENSPIDLNAPVGKELEAYVAPGEYEGKMQNQVKEVRKVGENPSGVPSEDVPF